MFDIIFIALARWDGPYSSTAYSIAKELSKTNRVFYIENPVTWKDFIVSIFKPLIKKRWQALLFGRDIFRKPEGEGLYIVIPMLVFPINWMPEGKLYRILLKLNNKIFNLTLRKTMANMNVKNYITINSFNPFYRLDINGYNQPAVEIYQSVDNMAKSSYIRKHGPLLEEEYAKKTDFCITTSTELKLKFSKYSTDVFLVPNAADIALFRTAYEEKLPMPDIFQGLNKKIIIYTGNICHRLDYDLLNAVALEQSDKILAMVGPVSANNESLKNLQKRKNVLFTGPKKLEELPAFLQHSDCAIIPFLCNELTRSIYPLKINEYLAAGIPVVTTDFSEDIGNFNEVIYLSGSHSSFINNVKVALKGDSKIEKLKRIEKASQNTWEARARQIRSIVNQYINEKEKTKA